MANATLRLASANVTVGSRGLIAVWSPVQPTPGLILNAVVLASGRATRLRQPARANQAGLERTVLELRAQQTAAAMGSVTHQLANALVML